MAEKEIKIGFSEAKMEALEFFIRENDSTVEKALKEHLDKIYEKNVPQQVRKFVESKLAPEQETVQEEGTETQRQTRGQGRRTSRQNAARETVPEQTDSGVRTADEGEVQETGQEQESGMVMGM